MNNKRIMNNTLMLMIFQIAKIVFPFITLPYLTRVLSTEIYGSVAYVKTVMSYMQIIVDFGFVLSATKEIVKFKTNKDKLNNIYSETIVARIILGLIGFIIITILICILPILRQNILFTYLSYLVVFLSVFLMDYIFRGLEKMHIITIRFVLMKIISTTLTFFLIKNDSNILLIPILDIISSLIAIFLVFFEIKKIDFKFIVPNIRSVIYSIKESSVYFISNAATTSFNALSTILIGIYVNSVDVAYWSVCMQIIGSIIACYAAISDGIYPEMIKTKDYNIIIKIEKKFLPIVIIGCIMLYLLSNFIFMTLSGTKYLAAIPIFRLLIPTLIFAFLSVIHGWPALGAIDKAKENTIATFVSIFFNIFTMVILIIIDNFNLYSIAITRCLTEFVFLVIRFYYCRKHKKLFN